MWPLAPPKNILKESSRRRWHFITFLTITLLYWPVPLPDLHFSKIPKNWYIGNKSKIVLKCLAQFAHICNLILLQPWMFSGPWEVAFNWILMHSICCPLPGISPVWLLSLFWHHNCIVSALWETLTWGRWERIWKCQHQNSQHSGEAWQEKIFRTGRVRKHQKSELVRLGINSTFCLICLQNFFLSLYLIIIRFKGFIIFWQATIIFSTCYFDNNSLILPKSRALAARVEYWKIFWCCAIWWDLKLEKWWRLILFWCVHKGHLRWILETVQRPTEQE